MTSSGSKWILCMMRICFRNVDFPLSPAPNSSSLTCRRKRCLSLSISLSISLLLYRCSISSALNLKHRQHGHVVHLAILRILSSSSAGRVHRAGGLRRRSLKAHAGRKTFREKKTRKIATDFGRAGRGGGPRSSGGRAETVRFFLKIKNRPYGDEVKRGDLRRGGRGKIAAARRTTYANRRKSAVPHNSVVRTGTASVVGEERS